MQGLLDNIAAQVAALAGGLALLALFCAVILHLFFKQDFRNAISKLGAIFLGLIVIAAGSAIVAAIQEFGGSI